MQLFSADPTIFSKTFSIFFFKLFFLQNHPQKLLRKTQIYFFPLTALSCPNGPNRRIHLSKCGLQTNSICIRTGSLGNLNSYVLVFSLFLMLLFTFYIGWRAKDSTLACQRFPSDVEKPKWSVDVRQVFITELCMVACFYYSDFKNNQ